MEEFINDKNILPSKKLLLYNPSPCDKMFKKDLFTKNNIKFLEGKYYEDLGTVPLFAIYTNNIKFTNHYLYHYVKREDSTMNKINYNTKIADIFYIMQNISIVFKQNNLDNEYKDELEYIYFHHLLRAASIRILNYDKIEMVDKIRSIMKEKYPNFTKNKYFKKYGFKRKLISKLIYNGKYKLIKELRKL